MRSSARIGLAGGSGVRRRREAGDGMGWGGRRSEEEMRRLGDAWVEGPCRALYSGQCVLTLSGLSSAASACASVATALVSVGCTVGAALRLGLCAL